MTSEIVKNILEQNIAIYIMAGLCALGVLFRFLTGIIYGVLIRASDNMGVSKNKLMKQLKLKFEANYELKLGVHNVDSFVDKYVYRYRFCGIHLYTWENLCGQALVLCMLVGSICTGLGIAYAYPKDIVFSTLFSGILFSALLITLEGLTNLNAKRQILKVNVIDYLENHLKIRLEQEYFNPDMLERYRKEYFEEEKKEKEITQKRKAGDLKRERAAKEVQKAKAEPAVSDMSVIEDILTEYLP